MNFKFALYKTKIIFFLLLSLSLTLAFSSLAHADCETGDGRPTCNQCTFKRTSDADWAMMSTATVLVDESNPRFISFKPQPASANNTALVIFHGGDVDWSAYAPQAHWAAQQGYKTFLMRFGDDGTSCLAPPLIETFYAQIDDLLNQNATEATQWVFAGHSLGGVTASGYMDNRAETRDEVKSIVYWASYTNFDLTDNPLIGDNVLASKDGVATWENYIADTVNFPNPTQTECIVGGNHAQFGWYGPQSPEDESEVVLTREQQQQLVRQRLLMHLDRIEAGTVIIGDDNYAETQSCQDIFIPANKGKKRKKKVN